MGGESLSEVFVAAGGIPGDRGWAVRDERRGGIRGAKKIAALMDCEARYLDPPRADGVPAAEITLPSGQRLMSDHDEASKRLSEAIDHPVTLCPLRPADDLDHYRRGPADDPDVEKELRAVFARLPDEPLPEIGRFPPEIFAYESPPGTYFDAFPLMLLTQASLDRMQGAAPDSRFDVRRFRPNLLIESDSNEGFPEQEWRERDLVIGAARIHVTIECPRCVMTTHGFGDLPADPEIMRSLVREAGGNLGVYARVLEPGPVRIGDPVALA